ncbi:MAG TPA: amidase [Ktedonobacteraceae bacterium]|jgi:amidase|nr:amidase [Ktedonobacteraceae bacterium]
MSTQDHLIETGKGQEIDAFASATDLLKALDAKQVSARELLDLYLWRIERYNPTINAIVVLDEEEARQSAMRADEMRARGEREPLLGLPITVKDSIDVRGLPGTMGVARYAQRRPEKDARIVERMRSAGTVIMGKTNVPPYTGDWQAVNPVYGRTRNPWNPDYTPGGSTGGGAAALAAGLTPLELGSDIGGSIRIPAAFCGVYGHKPSETALPRSGHFPGAPLPNPATAMAVLGPLARDANDLELALNVMAGPDVGEDAAWQLHLPPARHETLADFRVAVLPTLSWLPVDDEIRAAQEEVVKVLERSGARVEEVMPERLGDLREYYLLYVRLLSVMMNIGRRKDDLLKEAADLRATGDNFAIAGAEGREASAFDYIVWIARREVYRQAWRAFFQHWDVLLAPVNIGPAFQHTDAPWQDRWLRINGQTVPYDRQSAYPAIATLCGLPATAFPVGLTRAGLPIGLQAIGPYLEDRTPIRFAGLVTREHGGFQRPPGF